MELMECGFRETCGSLLAVFYKSVCINNDDYNALWAADQRNNFSKSRSIYSRDIKGIHTPFLLAVSL